MLIKSPAISGCTVSLDEDGHVIKSASDVSYHKRLHDQSDKQVDYQTTLFKYKIKVPTVWSRGAGFFSMDYLPFTNYIDYVERSSVEQVSSLLQRLFNFVEDSIDKSVNSEGSKSIRLAEQLLFIETQKKGFPTKYEWVADYIAERTASSPLPIGNCHGDLTMSNVLFGENEIALIDFNDTPISSPIFDVIKLRQDAVHHWTSFNTKASHDVTKIKIVDDWINCKLNTILIFHDVDMSKYRYWEALNYLRIFRNSNGDERLCQYLVDTIEKVLK